MSGHWPYIIAAYTICFVLFALDWFASVIELKNLKRDSIMRQRRGANRPDAGNPNPGNTKADNMQARNTELGNKQAVRDQSVNDKPMDASQ